MAANTTGMLDPGNVIVSSPYYVAGRSSITVPAAGSRVATLVNFGRIDVLGGGPIIPVPLRVSQVTLSFAVVSGNTLTAAFEVVKGTATVQDSANGSERPVVSRKRTGYQSVAPSEVSLYMTTAGTAVSGGNFAAVGDPFLMVGAGAAAAFGYGQAVWSPADLVPITLEAGEALAVQVTLQGGAAVGVLQASFDLLRQ